jgi:hypothetical protein
LLTWLISGETMFMATERRDKSKSSTLRPMSESMPDARFSSVWRASSSSLRRMSSITLVQIAEKPITVTTEEMISSFADSRQGWLVLPVRRPNPINSLPDEWDAPGVVAVG